MACLRVCAQRALVRFALFGLCFFVGQPAWARIWEISASEQMEYEAQEALIRSQPGDTILLPEGRFAMSVELTIAKPHITLKGQGRDKTELVYTQSAEGPQAIMITADHAVVEDLAVIDHPGDGIKAVGVNGTTIRRVKVEWTKRAAQENGAYGLYPVMSSNVLLEDNLVIGASDAGVYVGQSKNIIVRRNRVEYNVAGIEIENSQRADVYDNVATNNTGGVLVFNLPNLLVQGGRGTRVFKNQIFENNFVNFAPKGNSVALVPQGTGILIMSNDDIEIFENTIDRHNTTSIAIVSYHVTESAVQDPNYDAQPENIYIHNNKMRRAGMWPFIGGNKLGLITAVHSLPRRVPHVVYDGIGQADGKGGFSPASLQGNRRICLEQNDSDGGEAAIFGNMNFWKQKKWSPIPGDMKRNFEDYTCSLPRLATVSLASAPPAPARQAEPDQERIRELCEAEGEGVNWEALAVDCPLLSQYRLFQDPSNPLTNWTEGAIPYEPTTPLFSDYASKSRVLYLPPGTAAEYDPEATFKLPKGTVISKTFYFPSDLRQPDGPRRVIETRLLIHRKKGWEGLEYLWDAEGREARLIHGGAVVKVDWKDHQGKLISNNYRVPNLAQCVGCHANGTPIGIRAGFLNREGIGPLKGHNQLVFMAEHERLNSFPADLSEVPRYPVWNQPETGSLEQRARAYLDINCAHCHSISGKANTSALFLNYNHPLNINYGLCKPPIAAGRGAGGILFDIVPGEPEKSILLNRMKSTKAAIKMPELAKGMVHKEGVALIEEWVHSLPGECPEE